MLREENFLNLFFNKIYKFLQLNPAASGCLYGMSALNPLAWGLKEYRPEGLHIGSQ